MVFEGKCGALSMKLDKLDKRILRELQRDGTITNL